MLAFRVPRFVATNVIDYVNRCKSIAGYEYLSKTLAGISSPINVATGDASKFPTAKVGGSQSAAPVQRAIQGQGTGRGTGTVGVAGPAGASDSRIPKRYYYTTNNYVLKDEAAAVAKNALKGSIPGNVPGVSAFESPVNI